MVDTVYVKLWIPAVPFEAVFSLAHLTALLCWLVLVLLPRWPGFRVAIQSVVVGSDAAGLARWLQAPILLLTFMFGPIGLLVFAAVDPAGPIPPATMGSR